MSIDTQPATPTAPAAKPRRRWILTTTIALATLIIGIAIGSSGDTPTTPAPEVVTIDTDAELSAELTERAAALDEREADLDAREDALDGAEAEQAANTVSDGIWTVGVDIEPGTYRATGVGEDCYWGIYKSGTNGDEIINNDIPGGGNPTVTLSEGQDFESARCGEWTKQ
jgi:hypothetical protein